MQIIHRLFSQSRSSFSLLRHSIKSPISSSYYHYNHNHPIIQKMSPMKSACDLPSDARNILESIGSGWGEKNIGCDALQVVQLKGAMTNEVYQIKWAGVLDGQDRPRKVLVRIYGEGVDVFFDREDEISTFEFVSKMGQGPLLLGRFATGRIEEFIHARTLSASDLRDPDISAIIAAKMKEFHDLEMPGSRKVLMWDRLRNWLDVAKSMVTPEEARDFCFDTLDEEISSLEKSLSDNQTIGFCHNDLQYGNIMIDEETMSITIIDYEYASYNAVAYDIANHFCEMAADYHTETPHILDYSKYPDFEERKRFLRVYLSCSGKEYSDEDTEQLLQDVEKYTLVSHLLWGLWGIISVFTSFSFVFTFEKPCWANIDLKTLPNSVDGIIVYALYVLMSQCLHTSVQSYKHLKTNLRNFVHFIYPLRVSMKIGSRNEQK